MINYSNPIFMSLRKVGQNLGVLRPMVRIFRKVFNISYESSFDQQMIMGISQNAVVWDVGANIGYFTQKFAEKVGVNGQVFAFEPAQSSYLSLVDNCSGYKNVFCKNFALSNKSGSLSFRDSGIENDPTNGLVDHDSPNVIKVTVVSGDELVKTESVPIPNIVKIDVEGYEFEVIEGMREILKNSLLKKIFMEVHFLELNKRGLETAATDIVKAIVESGFSVKWTDPSHFIASR
jgi:FkbM family methyltransferase